MSGGFSKIILNEDSSPLKSGIKISIVASGILSRINLTVSENIDAPPSLSSSRSTDVITTCLRFNASTDSATLRGSSRSNSLGIPVLTLQNPQLLVQVSPKIINVAVLLFQHSARLGHFASSQTVFNFDLRINSWTSL